MSTNNRWPAMYDGPLTSLEGSLLQALWVAALFTLRQSGMEARERKGRITEPFLTMRQDEYALWAQLGSPPCPIGWMNFGHFLTDMGQ